MTCFIHPELHLALHRLRDEETERHCAQVRAMRGADPRRSRLLRLGSAVTAAAAAGRLAFAETPAVGTTVVKEGSGR